MRSSSVVPDTIEFHDIAGLVAGAHKGEGLGNQFLANIRETDALLHVVRVHDDPNVIHPEGRVDPAADMDTIETELIYADLEQAERRHARIVREARGGDRRAIAEEAWLRSAIEALQAGRPVRSVPVPEDAPNAARDLGALTAKPVLYVANVSEGDDDVPAVVTEHAAGREAAAVAISSRLEAELSELEDDEAEGMREELGISESGLQRVVGGAFSLLGLIAFFTAGEDKPAQSWHLRQGLSAWHAAGEIHSDIQRGFVRAEVIGWEALVESGGYAAGPRPRRAPARGSRLRHAGRRRDHRQVHAVAGHPALRRVELGHREHARLAGHHPREQPRGVGHPADVGHDRRPLPRPGMAHQVAAEPRVRPQRRRLDLLEVLDQVQRAQPAAALQRRVQRGSQHVAIVARLDAPAGAKPERALRHPLEALDHDASLQPSTRGLTPT